MNRIKVCSIRATMAEIYDNIEWHLRDGCKAY